MTPVTRALLLSASLLAGCSEPVSARVITLGAIIDATGTNADPSWRDAVKLAEREMNDALVSTGAFGDVRFEIELADSGNDPEIATFHALRLTRERGAKALLLDSSENSAAVNRMFYDFDLTNDPDVPLQCSGCTASSINDPAAVDGDAIRQDALRNARGWLFAGIMASDLVSLVTLRDFIGGADGGCREGDCNADANLKIATYTPDSLEGRSTVAAMTRYAKRFRTSSPPLFESVFHPRAADTSSYDWAADLRKVVNAADDVQSGAIGLPDLVAISTEAQFYVPVVRLFPPSTTRLRFALTENFRTASVLLSLGSQVEGREGVSQVVRENDASGQHFADEIQRLTGQDPAYRAAHYYDNAVTLMLAALKGAPVPEAVTDVSGAQVRDAMMQLNDPAGEVIRTGPAAFALAIEAIRDGRPFNYEGASGPMDYSAQRTVRNRLSRFRAENGRYVDVATYDCVASADRQNLAACPRL